MKLIKLNPKTPGTRHTIKITKNVLLKRNFLFKNLIQYKHKFMGRSSINGRITSDHKGAGCKKKFRNIDFKNEKKLGIILAISYDPSRTSFISLCFDLEKRKFFTIQAPFLSFTGFIYYCNNEINEIKSGFRTKIKSIASGSLINNIGLTANSTAKYARAAGTYCQLIQKTQITSKIRLPSGKFKEISNDSYATLGLNSNTQQNLVYIGKAGTNRLKGIKPSVRGIAMNPVDHPHGGNANSGFVYKTPWGKIAKGVKTRKKKKNE